MIAAKNRTADLPQPGRLPASSIILTRQALMPKVMPPLCQHQLRYRNQIANRYNVNRGSFIAVRPPKPASMASPVAKISSEMMTAVS